MVALPLSIAASDSDPACITVFGLAAHGLETLGRAALEGTIEGKVRIRSGLR
jgi:hypothetical protein